MLTIDGICFVSIPNPENKRLLIPGVVVQLEGETVVASFAETLPIEVGSEVMLVAEWKGKLFQQAFRLADRTEHQEGTHYTIKRAGEPINCDERAIYRVNIASQGYVAKVGSQSNCLLTDISPEGFSAVVKLPLEVGRSVQVAFDVEGTSINGQFRVQGERRLPNGTLRYGFHAFEKRSPLRKDLQTLSSTLQRLQLRRLAAAA